jgi:hypothetical protein
MFNPSLRVQQKDKPIVQQTDDLSICKDSLRLVLDMIKVFLINKKSLNDYSSDEINDIIDILKSCVNCGVIDEDTLQILKTILDYMSKYIQHTVRRPSDQRSNTTHHTRRKRFYPTY